jgi:hypothetical protein
MTMEATATKKPPTTKQLEARRDRLAAQLAGHQAKGHALGQQLQGVLGQLAAAKAGGSGNGAGH